MSSAKGEGADQMLADMDSAGITDPIEWVARDLERMAGDHPDENLGKLALEFRQFANIPRHRRPPGRYKALMRHLEQARTDSKDRGWVMSRRLVQHRLATGQKRGDE